MKGLMMLAAGCAILVAGCAMDVEPCEYQEPDSGLGRHLHLIGVDADPPLFDSMAIMLDGPDWHCETTAGALAASTHVCSGTAPTAVEWTVERSNGFTYADGWSVVTDGVGRLGEPGLWIVYVVD